MDYLTALSLNYEKEAGPVDEEAQCGGSLYETSVMAGSKIVMSGSTVII